jgi:hypothetical protein
LFLIKIVPLFAVFLFLWHARGLASGYYRLLAGFLNAVYPAFDPTGTVTGVVARGHEVGVLLVVNAQNELLKINATDITSNMAMLISLYLASPVRRRVKTFLLYCSSSLILIFFVHAFTVVTLSQEAFITHPGIMASSPFSSTHMTLVQLYDLFYVEVGMYLAVLVLWFPYIFWCIRVERGEARDDTSPPDS